MRPRARGSPAVRGVLYYENTWGAKPLRGVRARRGAPARAFRALDTAAEADTATGGVDRNGRIFPGHQDYHRAGDRNDFTDDVLRALCSTPGGTRARNPFPPACPSAEARTGKRTTGYPRALCPAC